MKKLLTVLPALVVLLFSCQKELSFDTPTDTGTGGAGTGTTGELLVKVVAVTGTETMTTLYTYDSQKRLETTTMDGTSAGMTIHDYTKLERDAAGRISRILQKTDQNGFSSDTAVNRIHYPNTTALEYDYSVNTIGAAGFSTLDSAVYTYAGGKVISALHYLSTPLLGTTPVQSSKYEFSYDGSGRVSVLKISATLSPTGGGSLTPIANETFTYGTSANYLWATNNSAQNLLITGFPNTVNSLVNKIQVDDLTDPSHSFTITSSYVMGADGKPTKATMTTTGGAQANQVTNYTFYYQ